MLIKRFLLIWMLNYIRNVMCQTLKINEQFWRPTGNKERDAQVRVKNGFTCSTLEFTFMVYITLEERTDLKVYCGGSLIGPYWVLTAAHCLIYQKGFLVYAAVNAPSGPVTRTSEQVFVHPDFNEKTFRSDIGLIMLAAPIVRSDYIDFIKIPTRRLSASYRNSICNSTLVMGWGYTNSRKTGRDLPEILNLQCVFIPVLPDEECFHSMGKMESDKMCALSLEGKDACQGDSGGPLLCGFIQMGVISWGINCGDGHHPGIYTRVDHHIDFINSVIATRSLNIATYNLYDNVLLIGILLSVNVYIYI